MSVIIIRRGSVKKQAEKSVLDYLSAVFEGNLESRKEVENMGGIGEALVTDARLEDLQHMIEIGLITNVDTAIKAYPTLREEEIQGIFNSLHNNED